MNSIAKPKTVRAMPTPLRAALDAAGMPVGLQLTARHGQEERLLAVALACERCLGTAADRIGRPPMISG